MWQRAYTHVGHQDMLSIIKTAFFGGNNVKTGCYFNENITDYFVVSYDKGRIYHEFAENIVVYITFRCSTKYPSENPA